MSVHIIMMLVPSLYIELINYFSISASKLGFIFSLSSFCFGVGSLPMSFLYNKFGPKKLIAFSQLGIFISALSVSLSNSVITFAITNIFLGIFASIHHPVSLTLISEVFEKNISKANAFHGVFGSIGVSLGPLIAFFAVSNLDWKSAFLIVALFNLFIIPLSLIFIPKTKKLNNVSLSDFKDRRQNNILKTFFIISLVVGLSFTIFNTFIPSVFSIEFGKDSNRLVSIIMLSGFIGQILSGILGDKFNRSKLLSIVFFLLMPLFILIFYVGNFSLISISAILAIMMYSIQPLINSIIKEIAPTNIRSIVFGSNFFIMFGVSGLAAYLGGIIADYYSFKVIFPIFSLLFPIGMILIFILNNQRRIG